MIFSVLYYFLIYCVLWPTLILLYTIFFIVVANSLGRRRQKLMHGGKHVAFFHPHCAAGGGGERVLWMAVETLLLEYHHHRVWVYCESGAQLSTVCDEVRRQFGIDLPRSALRLVPLRSCWLLQPRFYPMLTLLGQSIGSIIVAVEAVCRLPPDVYIDTTGCAFTMPVLKVLSGVGLRPRAPCRVACYVHYPTISSDMIARIGFKSGALSNFRSRLKLAYYLTFSVAYGIAGRCADVVMANGNWTAAHIISLWRGQHHVRLVFPPCDVRRIVEMTEPVDGLTEPVDGLTDGSSQSVAGRQRVILSVAQFRPEKDHSLQIRSFAHFVETDTANAYCDVKLVLAGGCRNAADYERVQQLRQLVAQLQLSERVEFEVNVAYGRLLQLYSQSLIGLHTMLDEHFGIGVVEMMAAGLIVVAHDSGGPRADIITVGSMITGDSDNKLRSGYLADSVETYSQTFRDILALTHAERQKIRARARRLAERFNVSQFKTRFVDACHSIL